MRNYIRAIAVLLVMCLSMTLAPANANMAQSAKVRIEDDKLEKAIREQWGIEVNPITTLEMDYDNTLVLPAIGIQSFKGLETAARLELLAASGNAISDLTPLSKLDKLKKLSLSFNQIKDITPLQQLPDVERLDLTGNLISDISGLPQSVVHLNLSGNLITDLEPLRDMDQLNELSIAHNPVKDLSPLLDVYVKKIDLTGIEIDMSDPVHAKVIQFLTSYNCEIIMDGSEKQFPQDIYMNFNDMYPDDSERFQGPDRYQGYAYGNGVYVAAGPSVSKDGLTWTRTSQKDVWGLDHIIFGHGKFIGFEGEEPVNVWTSKDGLYWTKNKEGIDTNHFIGDVAFNGKVFVAVTGHNAEGMIYTSGDGIKWTKRKSNITTDLKGIAYGNGVFVAMGYMGGVAAVSKDGITWKKVNTGVPSHIGIWSISFGGGLFLAGDQDIMLTSKDGQKWTVTNKKGYWGYVMWAKDRFFTDDQMSKDGKTWSSIPLVKKGHEDIYGVMLSLIHI